MDCLEIKQLQVYAYHGVFEEEKKLGQRFVFNIKLFYDMTNAAIHQDLTASVHYGVLAEQVTKWCQESSEDLIETLAYKLVNRIFQTYPLLDEVHLQVEKPWAPITQPLETVAVTLKRKKRTYLLGLGSNMGQREHYLAQARKTLEEKGFKVLRQSSIIETKAWGGVQQADFLNQVLEVESWFEPHHALSLLQEIERELGRVREQKWGPRTIDIDILFIGSEIYQQPDLLVPHPYLAERSFVLESLVELAPHFLDPRTGKSMRQLYDDIKKKEA